jgi:hypothetical protein
MSEKSNPKPLSEEQIDAIVVAQAKDDAAWDDPVSVHRDAPTLLSLSPELAARAAFFARLHRMSSAEDWLRSIIRERIDFEEAAFAGLKKSLVT